MRLIRFRGGYTAMNIQALTSYHNGLQATFGFSTIGAPILRTFAEDGIFAMAAYEEAVIGILAQAGKVRILAWVERTVDWENLKAFTRNTFGLTNTLEIEDTEI